VRQGRSWPDRRRIAGMLAHSHMREGRLRRLFGRLPERRDDPREVCLGSGLSVVGRRGDGTVFFEQFGLDVYGTAVPGPVRTVVDLGANVGYAALRLSRLYPKARLVCVEPVAAARSLLEDNLARNRVDAQVSGVAVVGAPGRYEIDADGHFGAASVRSSRGGPIEGITLVELLDRAGLDVVDLLKVDIEGSERDLLTRASGWAPRVRTILAELHDGLTREDAHGLLSPHGFRGLPLPRGLGFDELVLLTRASLS
jgi:FkbM family methyltransferase